MNTKPCFFYNCYFNLRHLSTLLLISMWIGSSTKADALDPKDVPQPLQPWIDWALPDEANFSDCPVHVKKEEFICDEPSTLELNITQDGAKFSFDSHVFSTSWISLPGSESHWPLEVFVNNEPMPVLKNAGKPYLDLKVGTYKIRGQFLWQQIPEILQLPPDFGRVSLTVNGKKVTSHHRLDDGGIKLSSYSSDEDTDSEPSDAISFYVMRKIKDGQPIEIETRIKIEVSGKPREIPLTDSLLPYGTLYNTSSELPLRIGANDLPIIMARPGQFTVTLKQNIYQAATDFPLEKTMQDVQDEIWVLEANNAIRQVKVTSKESIDTRETHLPSAWKGLPAYLLVPGDQLSLTQIKRGQDTPDANHLELKREIWLDFDGHGFTIKDFISGKINRDFRLNLRPPYSLERAEISGEDQYITLTKQLDDPKSESELELDSDSNSESKSEENAEAKAQSSKKPPPPQHSTELKGVEVRTMDLNLKAESRLSDRPTHVKLGWDQDFHKVRAQLNLPPGWRVWYGTGLDTLKGAWINQWTLLDLFMVFIIIQAIAKLWNIKLAIIAGIAIGFTWHEPDAPQWVWLLLLLGKALAHVLPDGVFFRVNAVYRYLVTVSFFITVFPFMVYLVRSNLYPQLETSQSQYASNVFVDSEESPLSLGDINNEQDMNHLNRNFANSAPTAPQEAAEAYGDGDGEQQDAQDEIQIQQVMPKVRAQKSKKEVGSGRSFGGFLAKKKRPLAMQQKDPNLVVQTGAGLPSWTWRSYQMIWDGPVTTDENLGLFLTPPWFNRALGLLMFLCWIVIIAMICEYDLSNPRGPKHTQTGSSRLNFFARSALILLLSLSSITGFLHSTPGKADTFPSKELLEELKKRLDENPDCYPECAFIESANLRIDETKFTLTIKAIANHPSYLPLPLDDDNILVTEVLKGADPVRYFLGTGDPRLSAIQLDRGIHELKISGTLQAQEVTMHFPVKPLHVTYEADDWDLAGIDQYQLDSNHIFMRRTKGDDPDGNKINQPFDEQNLHLPSSFRITKTIELGLDWTLTTEVTRYGSTNEPTIVAVHLLPDEAIVTENIKRKNNIATISFDRGQNRIVFESTLKVAPNITLTAAPEPNTVETWMFEISPLWRVQFEGIPTIVQPTSGTWQPVWRPWPGEQISATITKPRGAPGQSITIDRSDIAMTLGKRSIDGTLAFDLRTSRGARHPIKLPPNSELLSLKINGKVQNIKAKNDTITLPLSPGKQSIAVEFRQKSGVGLLFESPQFNLGTPSVNHQIEVTVPARWILFLGGPTLGPAVLFWGELIVLILISIALGRSNFLPIKTYQWILIALGTGNIDFFATIIVILFFVCVAVKERCHDKLSTISFNLMQAFLVLLSIITLVTIYAVVSTGLLSEPNMEITGSNSTAHLLKWFQDRTDPALPQVWILSLPIIVYRIVMLVWALWFAYALTKWIKWFWQSFSKGGLWHRLPEKAPKAFKKPAPSSPSQATPTSEPTSNQGGPNPFKE